MTDTDAIVAQAFIGEFDTSQKISAALLTETVAIVAQAFVGEFAPSQNFLPHRDGY